MEKMKNIFGRNMAKMLVFLIGGILVLGLLSYGLLTLSKTVAGQGHKIEICTYYQDNSTKKLSNSAGTITVNGSLSDSVQGRVGSAVTLSATPNDNYQFMGFYRDLEFTDVISRDSSCVYEISAEDEKIFAQFLKVYPVTFTFQDANFTTHTITQNFPYGYTFGQEEIKELIEQEAGESGLSVFENKLAKLNPSPETATDTTSTNMCFTVGSGASFFNLTPAPLDDVGISGSGTSASPYLIANATDLATFRGYINNNTNRSAHGKLTANITLSGTWTPIGNSTYPYAGTFDGAFFSVSGLSISSSSSCLGFFGVANGATIKNVVLSGTISVGQQSGAFVGFTTGNRTSLINLYNKCTIKSSTQVIGGIVGDGTNANIINCGNSGTITSTQADSDCELSGICGCSRNALIYNCYNSGSISSSAGNSETAVSGVCGENGVAGTKIINCYNMSGVARSKVYSNGNAGGAVSYTLVKGNALFNSSTQIITPYESGVTTRYVYNIATDAGTSMASTTTLLEALNKFVELNPTMEGVSLSTWGIKTAYPEFGVPVNFNANGGFRLEQQSSLDPNNLSFPMILPMKNYILSGWYTAASGGTQVTSSNVTSITSGQTLYARWQSYTMSGGGSGTSASPYIIKTEQDLKVFRDWVNATSSNSGLCAKLGANITLTSSWTPIGNYGVWNDAIFTGTFDGGFYKISGLNIDSKHAYQGLLGYANSAIIKNVNINGGMVKTTSLTGESTNDNNIGAICGGATGGTKFINCSTTCNVSGIGQLIGGVCGFSYGAYFINCFNGGTITSSQTGVDCEIAGICGCVSNQATSLSVFYNCYNNGEVNSGDTSNKVRAGILGENGVVGTNLINCYSMNSVAGNIIYGTGSTESRAFGTTKGYSLFNASTQVLASTISVYKISTDVGTSMSSSTTLLQALNKFVELNPTMEGVNLSSWHKPSTYPEFGASVSFNANGGSGAPSKQSSSNSSIKISSTKPTRTGYTFKGWGTTSSTTTVSYSSDSTYTFFGEVTVYAVWQANTYTVAYNANGGTGTTASSSHTYDANNALTSNGFSKTGYNFAGWSTSSSATTHTYTNGQSVSNLSSTQGATVTLYAVWKANTYTVVYNANGGLGSMANSTHTYDTAKALTANAYTKQGYIFLGWSKTQSATSATYTDKQSVKNLTSTNGGTVTLYAVWGYTYAIQYNGNGATSGSTATSVHTSNVAKTLTANGFGRTGYTFLGWSTSSAATSATYTDKQSVSNLASTQYETVTLYAVWKGNSYTVKYNANGGSGSMSNSSHVYGTFSPLSACTFEKEGHFFVGWSKDSNAIYESYDDKEEVWNLSATNGATITLYAIWLKKDITVTVDPNGGVYNGVETATVYNCSVGSDLVLGVPSRLGYEFTEFNTQGDGLGQTLNGTMVLNGDVTFYALWEPLNYVIKYYDGDLYLGQTEAWYNENLSLPRWETLLQNNSLSGGKFKQYGWNFAGWTADSNGSAIQHTNGGAVLNLAEAGTTINLYAMHTQTLNLSYNGNGSTSGNVASQSTDILLNSKSEKLADFVIKLANNSYAKTNYSFKNWAIGSTSGTQKSAGTNITNVDLNLTYSSGFSKTFYAIWQGNSYTINYYNGTSKISTGNYVYGNSATLKNFSTIGTVNNLAYGWEFYGWATANNTFTRVFEDSANITNISVDDGSEITQNMVMDLYSIYSREVSFVSGLNKASITTATQFWNPYSTNNSNLSSVLAEEPQTIETGNWIALGYRTDLTAGTATFALTTTTEIRPTANAFNTLYAVYSRTITIADLNTTTTATQYYNSVGTVSTVGQ